jgi:hypothetical protein
MISPRALRRHQDQGRQPHLPRHRHHGLSQELENAAATADHVSTRTTQLYARRREDIRLDEVERISI